MVFPGRELERQDLDLRVPLAANRLRHRIDLRQHIRLGLRLDALGLLADLRPLLLLATHHLVLVRAIGGDSGLARVVQRLERG
jgi:hypothetical protein